MAESLLHHRLQQAGIHRSQGFFFDFKREEQLRFDIAECDRATWRYFSKYHYLSDKLPGGFIKTFGLFHEGNQIGFQCFAEYTPWRDRRQRRKLHSNRTVIHPDYVGLGLGIKLINVTSQLMYDEGYDIWAKYTALPVFKAMSRYSDWVLMDVQIDTSKGAGTLQRTSGFRKKVKWWSFRYVPQKAAGKKP